MSTTENFRLIYHYDAETRWIEPWGPNAFRVRATKTNSVPLQNWGLSQPVVPTPSSTAIVEREGNHATMSNGKIHVHVTSGGKITIRNAQGKVLLEEYARNRLDPTDPKCSALNIEARGFKPRIGGSDYHLTARFESLDKNEKIYGMGQYQQPFVDLKGCDLELAQRNWQASVPFMLSSLSYGFL
jgi:alpha-D-xyloside xylohydrolase